MATYVELRTLFTDDTLRNRVEVAIIIAAETIRTEDDQLTNHANRLLWAKKAFERTSQIRDEMTKALIAQNSDASTTQILAATDAVLQANVDAAVDIFADGT